MYKYLLVFLVSLSFFAFLIPKKKALLRVAGPTIVMAILMGLGAVSSLPSVLGYMIVPLWFLAVINLFLFLSPTGWKPEK